MGSYASRVTETKVCKRCGDRLPLTDFYPHKAMKSGRLNICKTCKIAETDAWRRANRERFNEKRREREIRKYGITVAEYDAMLEAQGGVCVGCGATGHEHHHERGNFTSSRPLTVDHCHKSKAVRGLLCHDCNRAIGVLGDDPERLDRLAQYLRTSQETREP